jgi:hypothetical protein
MTRSPGVLLPHSLYLDGTRDNNKVRPGISPAPVTARFDEQAAAERAIASHGRSWQQAAARAHQKGAQLDHNQHGMAPGGLVSGLKALQLTLQPCFLRQCMCTDSSHTAVMTVQLGDTCCADTQAYHKLLLCRFGWKAALAVYPPTLTNKVHPGPHHALEQLLHVDHVTR